MTNITVSGLPGNMATEVARQILASNDLTLLPWAYTGPDMPDYVKVDGKNIRTYGPKKRNILPGHQSFIAVDYTHPNAVNDNCDYYCQSGIPFVMGTTGGDREALEQRVKDSDNVAIIAPNMAKQIVAFQAMMKYAAETFPDVFKGYSLNIWESHQSGKADTSGTAKAMLTSFNQMGIPFTKDQIEMERDKEQQWRLHGVPMEHVDGHGWHTYTLKSENKDVLFEFKHNVNGRGVYAQGTLDAVRFLDKKIKAGEKGKVYSMIDVLSQKLK